MDEQPAVRNTFSVLAGPERRVLNAICVRLPDFITPNRLTLLGFTGALLVFAGFAFSTYSPAFLLVCIAGYCVHWLGDSLDGMLARARKIARPRFGMFVDQTTDVLSIFVMVLGLAASPWVRADIALTAFAVYLLSAVLVHLGASVVSPQEITTHRIGSIEGRLLAAGLTIIMAFTSPAPIVGWLGGLGYFDCLLIAAMVWGAYRWLAETTRIARRLAREEPPDRKRA